MSKVLVKTVTIHDCRIDTFCTGGHGGQNQNAKQKGVRITHEPSGAVGECREERHQHINKQRAFVRMARSPAFTRWVRLEAARMANAKTVDQLVDESMLPVHLKVEARDSNGRWVTYDGNQSENVGVPEGDHLR